MCRVDSRRRDSIKGDEEAENGNERSRLEDIDIPLERTRIAGKKQYERISKEVRHSPGLAELSKQLEEIYDQEESPSHEENIELPPSIQQVIDEALGKDES